MPADTPSAPPTAASPLCSATWLAQAVAAQLAAQDAENPAEGNLRILDCRSSLSDPTLGQRSYAAGHVPGAVYADLNRQLSGPVQPSGVGGRHPLPDPDTLAQWLGASGISSRDTVICYDDPSGGGNFFAARAWWLLRWLGHRQVYVLDGGWPAYLAAGGPTSSAPALLPAADFRAQVQPDLLVSAADVLTRSPATLLIDSRAPERYRGEHEPLDRQAGHIPGAVNLPFAETFGAEGHFLPAAAQAKRLGTASPTISYCGSGVSATPNLLARELAGIPLGPQNRLYAGSWSDWISDPQRPIAVGDAGDDHTQEASKKGGPPSP